ncbi:MAG: nucleoside kinase [Anaerolineae bacterium]|nr:nucleoside kinase [Anaerolineae bacterium]
MAEKPSVWPAQPRETVQVRLPDGRTFEGPVQTPLYAFITAAYPQSRPPIMAALVDGELEELTLPISRDVEVIPIDTSTNDGMRIYQRSLSFVLVVAVRELFPQARVIIDHSVTMGGYFCQIEGRPPFTAQELGAIEQRMREIIRANEPITKEHIPTEEAIALFASQGYEDKVRLLRHHEEKEVSIYSLRGVRDYFYGYMAPSTGELRWFHLEMHPPGFILRLPSRHNPTTLPPSKDYPKLMHVFREYRRWLNILGISDIGALNEAVATGGIRKAILVSEALHEKHIADIAEAIVQSGQVRLVLIAGPSSSGKTTFARRLAIQLMANGLRPFALGLDDYFVDRELTPRDENGEYDFEALEALNLPLFNEQIQALMAGEKVRLPRYNFKAGKSEPGPEVRLPKDTIIIVEGIHGLNPKLVPAVPTEAVFRIYVSALTQLNIDHHNRVPTTDTRLLRRIVRDAQYRGYSARETIERWESVRRGEERNIFPYQENADVMFNSALVYELAVLKPFAEPLLLRVPRGTMESLEARRLLAFLRWVRPCPPDLVPDNSLLREFIGGSILRDFTF